MLPTNNETAVYMNKAVVTITVDIKLQRKYDEKIR